MNRNQERNAKTFQYNLIGTIHKMTNESIGDNRLYKMGFDGGCIGTLRKLTPEQVKYLVEILDELRNKKK